MYVDVLFIENLIINFVILSMTARYSKFKTSKIRLFTGAAAGALYIIVFFFPSIKMFYTLTMKIAVSILMIVIAFTPERFKDFFKVSGIFYIISFLFGGAGLALFYMSGRGRVINGAFIISDFPLSLLITAFALVYMMVVYCWDYVQNKILNDNLMYNVIIKLDNKEVSIDAIVDTGNSLKDPISNFPVIVVEYEALINVLPDKLMDIFKNRYDQEMDLEKLCKLIDNTSLVVRIRLIPFSSLGKQNGMLIGIKPDKVTINSTKIRREIKDVVVGIYNNKISKNGEYKGLLYPEIIK